MVVIGNVDFTHQRLVELTSLADRAKPFYDWVETQFQRYLGQTQSLHQFLSHLDAEAIRKGIQHCYIPSRSEPVPHLFDGVGRTYPHTKACFYFFGWLIRDAHQQRLRPLIQRIAQTTREGRHEVETKALALLITTYREQVKTFQWEAIREVILDRLEGSRRSIKGHDLEVAIRTALVVAIEDVFERTKHYGIYLDVIVASGQTTIGKETYDVVARLIGAEDRVSRRVLIAIKTRETEGGGHSHLFSRDILSAVKSVRSHNPEDFIGVVIVAKHWSQREADTLTEVADHLIHIQGSPTDFRGLDEHDQSGLNRFIASVLGGVITPKGEL